MEAMGAQTPGLLAGVALAILLCIYVFRQERQREAPGAGQRLAALRSRLEEIEESLREFEFEQSAGLAQPAEFAPELEALRREADLLRAERRRLQEEIQRPTPSSLVTERKDSGTL